MTRVLILTLILDVWSAGCVLAELLLGQPIFPGDSGVDQLVEIIKVLGTPTRDQIKEMNPNYTEFKFPQIKSHPWQKVSHSHPLSLSLLILLSIHLFFLTLFILSSIYFFFVWIFPEKQNPTKFKEFQHFNFFWDLILRITQNLKNQYVQSILN